MKDKNLRNIQRFLQLAKGNIKNISQKHEHEPINYHHYEYGTASYHMTTKVVNIVEMECEMEELSKIIERFIEFEQMQYDPECRDLINQAKFVNRLKNGVNYDPL